MLCCLMHALQHMQQTPTYLGVRASSEAECQAQDEDLPSYSQQ